MTKKKPAKKGSSSGGTCPAPVALNMPSFDDFREFYSSKFVWYETPNKGVDYRLRLWSCIQALNDGDQSFAVKSLADIQKRLMRGVALDEVDQWFLSMVIGRIGNCPSAINAICDSQEKRGAGKKGYKGFAVGLAVQKALDNSAPSLEAAWDYAAEDQNISVSMVKKYWSAWKQPIKEILEMERHINSSEYQEQ